VTSALSIPPLVESEAGATCASSALPVLYARVLFPVRRSSCIRCAPPARSSVSSWTEGLPCQWSTILHIRIARSMEATLPGQQLHLNQQSFLYTLVCFHPFIFPLQHIITIITIPSCLPRPLINGLHTPPLNGRVQRFYNSCCLIKYKKNQSASLTCHDHLQP